MPCQGMSGASKYTADWPNMLCRVSGLKGVNVVTAAAANRHTVVAASDGRVFSWGSNLQGQLGYGTSDSASNATPRLVEAMKVKLWFYIGSAKDLPRLGCFVMAPL